MFSQMVLGDCEYMMGRAWRVVLLKFGVGFAYDWAGSTGSLWSHDSDRGVAAVYYGISIDVIIAKVYSTI